MPKPTHLNWPDETFYTTNPTRKALRDACLERVNWPALCAYASSLTNNAPCTLLDKSTSGGVHVIRLLEFEETNTQWIARVQLEPSTPETATALRAEVEAMELIRARNGGRDGGAGEPETLVVPEIYGYEADDANPVGAAFLLMEFLPGSSAMDAAGGYEVHRGRVPAQWRRAFYHEMAGIQVHLSSIRLPQIGTVVKRADGSFDVGPLPVLGGPFSTASAFCEAWASHARFPKKDAEIQRCAAGCPMPKLLQSIHAFPRRLRNLASAGRIARYDHGPFPLYHPDLYTSIVVVDEDAAFRVLGIVDWEGACSVPWEVVQVPLFVAVLPRGMDDPGNGWQAQRCGGCAGVEEREEYVGFVRDAERRRGLCGDQRLSAVLSDPVVQGLAFALKVYLDPGKVGFYCKVLEGFKGEEG
ncbi:hypothetical protein BJY00DRAFT_321442 [Aspergillus carlsbadensis]|nr:hypothetical protein BJY00DRAFT_321442 [Aspergillus carlsbadensis]